jgi:hypothetical protein
MGSTLLNDAGNRIGSFNAASTGTGNIELTSVGAIDVQGITTAAGNITVLNTGGITTSGALVANSGKVFMQANSPLTIGTAGVTATGDIELVASNLTSAGNLTLNGDLVSRSGAVSMSAASNFVQNGLVSAALGVSVTAGGTVTLGSLARSFGNPVKYSSNGTPVSAPPGSQAAGSAATAPAVIFSNQFEALINEPVLVSVDPLALLDKDKKGLTIEGDLCSR